MDGVVNLLESVVNVFWSLLDVVVALAMLIFPWLPLLAWLGFWTFAVNWTKAFPVLWRGGIVGVLLLMIVTVLVWGAVAPPETGSHVLFGLVVSNFPGKFIYVTMLTCIALLCGSAQLSGAFGRLAEFPEEDCTDDGVHGHGDGHVHQAAASGHGHAAQGHAAHGH